MAMRRFDSNSFELNSHLERFELNSHLAERGQHTSIGKHPN